MKKIVLLLALAGFIFSCTNPAANSVPDHTAANKAKTRRAYNELFNAHNVAVADSFLAPDIVDHNPDPGHSGKGLDDVKAMLTQMLTAFPDLHVTPDFLIAEGDTVVAYLTLTGTNSGPMGNMPATNKSFTINGIDILRIQNGKAVERWGVFDDMALMTQIGMMGGEAPANSSR